MAGSLKVGGRGKSSVVRDAGLGGGVKQFKTLESKEGISRRGSQGGVAVPSTGSMF